MRRLVDTPSRVLSSPIARHPRLVLAACLALSAAALAPAARIRIDSDLASLLPDGAPASEDYRLFLRTFGGFEKVFVLVRSPGRRLEDPAPLEDAAAALAGELRASPEVADARSGRTEEDERFFYRWLAPRLPLLLGDERSAGGSGSGAGAGAGAGPSAGPSAGAGAGPGAGAGAGAGALSGGGDGDDGGPGRLARSLAPAAIHRRVQIMRETLAGPAGVALGPLYASDPLGLSEGLLGALAAAIPMDPLSGAFLSRRGDAALVMVTPARAELDPAGGRALLARLRAAYARVRAASPVPLEFTAVGGPIYAAQDEGILRADLARTGSSTVAGVALVLLAGFEGLLLPAAILVTVLVGIVWVAGVVGLTMPAMTVVGVGFAAALVGMGVDYGIHGGVQYRQLRLGGDGVAAALAGAFRDTGPGVLTASLSTTAGLAALASAHFRPLREIGMVLALGVLATLLATVTLSAALVAGFPGAAARPPSRPRLWARWGQPGLRALARLPVRRPRAVLAAALALTVFAAWGLTRASLSTDLRALRPADAPSVEAERLLVESFSLGIDTLSVVVRGGGLDQALDRAAAAAALLRRRLGPQAEVTTPSDWLAQGARRGRRLAELRRLPLGRAADDLERELAAAGFRREPFAPALAALRGFARGEDPGAPPAGAWPSWMRELVRAGPGVYGVPPGGAAVAVHVRLPRAGSGGGGGAALPAALARELARVAPGAAVASAARVGVELKDLALADLARASGIALALVATVVLVSFRGHAGRALLAFLPFTLGCLWTFGVWSACGQPFDLLGVFTVPLLLGTGINLGAHAVHWQRLYPRRGLAGAVEDIGLAMMMATFTTALGFGSLVSSRVPGLAHDGLLVAAGITTCLLVAFLVLPALEALRAAAAPAKAAEAGEEAEAAEAGKAAEAGAPAAGERGPRRG
jgi:predicted RND superfamily exporter protein